MRKRLAKSIRKKFGPVYWSKKLRAQRREIVSDALDRYDEEIANGSTPNVAFYTVYNSVGNLDALRKEFGVDKRCKAFLIVILSVLSVLISAPVLIWMPVFLNFFFGWIIIAVYLSALACLLYCSWRLLTKDYNGAGWLIAGTILGGILVLLPICFRINTGLNDLRNKETALPSVEHFSCTDKIDRIESIEYIRVEEWKPSENLPFTYTVIADIDRALWESCLMDLGPVEMHLEQQSRMKEEGFLIRYSGNDPTYVLYGETFFAIAKRTGTGTTFQRFRFYPGTLEWKQTLRKYVNGNGT